MSPQAPEPLFLKGGTMVNNDCPKVLIDWAKKQGHNEIDYRERMSKMEKWFIPCTLLAILLTLTIFVSCAKAEYTDEQIANAIYLAEGGAKTSHPYGILVHYKTTSPRQACLNTIAHARRDFKGGDFIVFLGSRYCPVGAANDPTGLNKNWIKNVKYFLERK